MGKKKNKNKKKKTKKDYVENRIVEGNNQKNLKEDDINDKIELLNEMCSKEEMEERQNENLLNVFEINYKEDKIYIPKKKAFVYQVNPLYAIKSYIRPSIEKKDIKIRPPEILYKTLNFILDNIIDSDTIINSNFPEVNFSDIFLFVEDRFKSIKQDFIKLNDNNSKEFFYCFEIIIRFQILSLNQSLDYPSINGSQGLYKLLINQIHSGLINLVNSYKNNDISNNKDEFYSYFLLISIKLNPLEFFNSISKIPKQYIKKKNVKLSLKICSLINEKNWYDFFKIIKSNECPYLLSCLMMIFVNQMRVYCLLELGSGLLPKQTQYETTLKKLADLLIFDNIQELKQFIINFGLKVFPNMNKAKELITLYLDRDFVLNFNLLYIKTNKNIVEKKRNGLLRKDIILNDFNVITKKKKNINFKEFLVNIFQKYKFNEEKYPLLISISYILIIKLIAKYCVKNKLKKYKKIMNQKIVKVKNSEENNIAFNILKLFIQKISNYIIVKNKITFSKDYISNLINNIIKNEKLEKYELLNYIENEFNNYIEKIKNLRTLFLEQNKKNKKKLLNKKRKRIEQCKF
jgi:hypothetical protein